MVDNNKDNSKSINKQKKKKTIIIILSIIILLLLAGFVGANIYFNSLLSKMDIQSEEDFTKEELYIEPVKPTQKEESKEPEKPKRHEVLNVMIVGADNSAGIGSYDEERSDVFKVATIDYTEKKLKLTSLDRDVVVFIPDKGKKGEYGHFNWAYSFGGAKYALSTINYNLDLDVSKYVTFSFAGFINVIDILGGVDINLTAAEANYMAGSMSIWPVEGINHLNGNDALIYARTRHLDNDFFRMNRQNNVIKAVINKMKNSSINELLEVVNSCMPYITTNLSIEEIKYLLLDLLSFDLSDIQTHMFPTDGYDDISACKPSMGGYILKSYLTQVQRMHKFIYGEENYEPSQRVVDNERNTYEYFGFSYEDNVGQ